MVTLYHGSGYLHDTLKAGFHRTGEVKQWDNTEDNSWLYAYRDLDMALAMGAASAAEQIGDVSQFSWDCNVVTIHVKKRFSVLKWLRHDLLAYRINKVRSHKWVQNKNQYNDAKDEYKTQAFITPKHIAGIMRMSVGQWMQNKTLVIHWQNKITIRTFSNPYDTLFVDWIYGNCPVQAEGTIDGHQLYFRARGEHWQVRIADGDVFAISAWVHREAYGTQKYEAGWMPEHEAMQFILKAVALWKKSRLEKVSG